MAERPSKPPFSEKGTDNEDQLARILNKKPALVGETYLPRTGKALEYAKLLLAEDATPKQKQQLKKAWEWRDGEYAEWRRKCDKAAVEAQRAALEERPEKRQRRQPKLMREAEAEKGKEKELKAKELREAHDQMQLAYDADPQGAICRFTEKIEELSKEPASTAIDLNGLCACSGSHAVVKSLGLAVAVAAEKYWRAHPVSALREALDVPKLLREVFQRVPDLNGADSVSSIMMLRFDGVEVAPLRRSRRETRRFPDGSIPRRRRNGRGPVGRARVGGVFVCRSGAAAGARVRRGQGPTYL